MSGFDHLERDPLPRRASGAVPSHRGLAEDRFLRTTPEDGGLLHIWDQLEEMGVKDEELDPWKDGGFDSIRGGNSANATQRDFASGERSFGFQYPLIPGGRVPRSGSMAGAAKQVPERARGGSFTEGLRDYWKGNYQGTSAVEAEFAERGNRLGAIANDGTFSDVQSMEGFAADDSKATTSAAAQKASRPWHKSSWLPWNWNWGKLLPWNWGKKSAATQKEPPKAPQASRRKQARQGGSLDEIDWDDEEQMRLMDMI